ncbi:MULTISPECIES: amino acid adenylation domain-containing protein [unclassified Streptomyces]|uniref:amino acid adenylation domain-containing protein n=1 Tax=unclassified Streptomyces TaxID=2593676 RepID=UPI0032485BBF
MTEVVPVPDCFREVSGRRRHTNVSTSAEKLGWGCEESARLLSVVLTVLQWRTGRGDDFELDRPGCSFTSHNGETPSERAERLATFLRGDTDWVMQGDICSSEPLGFRLSTVFTGDADVPDKGLVVSCRFSGPGAPSLLLQASEPYAARVPLESVRQEIEEWCARWTEVSDHPIGRIELLRRADAAVQDGLDRDLSRKFDDSGIPAQVLAHAAEDPHLVAVTTEQGDTTYGELERFSGALAEQLRAAGIGTGAVVPIVTRRGLFHIVAMLAVMRVGAAYSCFDAEQLNQRDVQALSALGPDWVLVDGEADRVEDADDATEGPLSRHFRDRRVIRGHVADDLPGQSVSQVPALSDAVPAHRLTHVIHTSGSTGMPKAVGIRHESVLNFSLESDFLPGEHRRVFVHYSSMSFDAATFEIWTPLIRGDRVVVAPPGRVTPRALGTLMRRHGVTTLWVTIGLLQALAADDISLIDGPVEIYTGGDVVDPAVIRTTLEAVEGRSVTVAYGPTETTIWVTTRRYEKATDVPAWMPLGAPIQGALIQVLDPLGRRLPPGVPGELCVAGLPVSAGYLDNQQASSAKFTPCTWSSRAERMYRTGDVVRLGGTGEFEFLGRVDSQIKAGGFRIELDEVEVLLRRYPAVTDVAVAAVPDSLGRLQVHAWVTPRDPGLTAEDVQDYARHHLPDYMVPSRYWSAEAIPLNRNDKVDRKALTVGPLVPLATRHGGGDLVTPTEQLVGEIWQQVLDCDRIARDDDFFTVGGSSLAALRVMAAIEKAVSVALPPSAAFRHRTPRKLALAVEAARDAGPTEQQADASSGDGHRLTPEQSSLLFMQELFGDGKPVYHVPLLFELTGDVDPERLCRAVDDVAADDVALRSTLTRREGTYWSVPVADRPRAMFLDLGSESPADAEQQADAIVADVCSRAFAEGEALFRCVVLRHPGGRVVLAAVAHHVVFDGASRTLFMRRLEAAYAGRPLQASRYPFTAPVQRESGPAAEEYWRAVFSSPPPVLDLSPERRPETFSGAGRTYRFDWSDLLARVESVADRTGGTLTSVLLAGFAIVLGRFARQDDVVVATAFSGRHRNDSADAIGMHVRTLPLRMNVDPAMPGGHFVRSAQRLLLEALEHSDCGFDRIVALAGADRDAARVPLAQTMLVVNEEADDWFTSVDGVRCAAMPIDLGVARFDLAVSFGVSDGRLIGTAEFAHEAVPEHLVTSLVDSWYGLLDSLHDAPEKPIGSLTLMSDTDQEALLRRGTGRRSRPSAATLWDAVARWERESPSAVALRTSDSATTYTELMRRARALRAELHSRGVRAGDVVAMGLPRGVAVIEAMLAVAGLGAAYMPLPAGTSGERLRSLLAASGTKWLLTDGDAPAVDAVVHLSLPELVDALGGTVTGAAPEAAGPSRGPRTDDLLCVMTTSGTTGTPKAIGLTHTNLLSFTADPDFDEGHEVVVFHAPHSFDAAAYEIWVPLTRGNTVFVAPDRQFDLMDYRWLIETSRATAMAVTAGLFRVLAQADPSCFAGLKTVLTGGDVVTVESVRDVLSACPDLVVRHQYGPTETTTFATTLRIDASTDLSGVERLPLGGPTAGTRVHVLDRNLNPVPPGCTGEICIAGDGVALGYRSADRTAHENFVADPFGAPGARMYRTGDNGYWSDAGLNFAGRADQQVKIRGFRVEPGEVDHAIRKQSGVADVAVCVLDGGERGKYLGAIVVPDEGVSLTPQALHASLAAQLPDYLVPSRTVVLPALPMTRNGKVDTGVLREPSATEGAGPRAGLAEPEGSSGAAGAVLTCMREVLGVPTLREEDNFFDFGGSSLDAMRLAAMLRDSGLRCSVRDLYRHQTAALLAQSCQAA